MNLQGNVTPSGPLEGIKILDLTSVVMGPFATQILAQLGAEVIKIETADGDDMRGVGPMRNPGMGPIFLQANQGKRSIAIDLKSPAGREVALRVAEMSDVFITNIRPQALRRLGLNYESVADRNPSIIHVSCCGFDQDGPYADKPAYDDLIQGATCVPWLTQQYGATSPSYAPFTLADRIAGFHVVYAVTAALYSRAMSGQGQSVVVPMFEAMAQFVLADHLGGLAFDPEIGEPGYSRLLTHFRRPFRTSDGLLCVLPYNDKHWKSFFVAIGDPGRLDRDQRFSSHRARLENIEAVYEEVSRILLTRPGAEWRAILDAADIPNMPVNDPRSLLNDPQIRATDLIASVDHPSEGKLRIPRNPTKWSATPLARRIRPAPRLGEHTDEVLRELGYSNEEIGTLRRNGVCKSSNALQESQ